MSFFEIFNPGERYMREEKDRQKMLVSKPTPGGGAPLGIDLDGGKAKIVIRTSSGPESDPSPAEDEMSESLEASDGSVDASGTDTPEDEQSPEADETPEAGLSSR